MFRRVKTVLLIFCCFFGLTNRAQDQKTIDSLKVLLISAKDTTELHLLNKLWFQYRKKRDYATMISLSREAYAKAVKGHFSNEEAEALNGIAGTYMDQNIYDSCVLYCLKAIEAGKKSNNARMLSNSYTFLGLSYARSGKTDLAFVNLFKALELRKEVGEKNFIADVYHFISVTHKSKGQFDSAVKYESEALKLRLADGKKYKIGLTYNNIGEIHMLKGEYEKALENILIALKYREEAGDKMMIANSYNSIGLVYQYLNRYEKALDYYLKALKNEEELNDKVGIATSCGNIGSVYYSLKDLVRSREYDLRALKLFEEVHDESNVAALWNNIGLIYSEEGQYKTSLEYLLKARDYLEVLNEKKSLSGCYKSIGINYVKLGEYKAAAENLLKAERISKETGQKDDLKEALLNLSEVYSQTGKYQLAFEKLKQFNSLKDSLFSVENSKSIAEMEGKYNTEKKEKEILKLNTEREKKEAQAIADKKQRQIIYISLSIFLSLAALLSFVIFRNYRQKQKARIEAIEKEKIKADLSLLKNQISPHVMFNSLNTIYFQMDEDKENSKEMILQFADLLRYQLYECNVEFTDVANEISYMSKFVEIQRLRKSSRCKIDFKVGENVKNFVIAPLLMIPLVENAFKYVTNDKDFENYISIALSKEGNKIEFSTENTAYESEEPENKKIHKGGIGLTNLKERLALIYPNKHELKIERENNIFKTKLVIYV
jgi:tetratricopeptide (TPR) repeat protein